jgi:hypothetical protein
VSETGSANLDTLRRNLRRLIEDEQTRLKGRGAEKRRHKRHYYIVEARVTYAKRFERVSTSPAEFMVLTKDISRSGLSFIHDNELFAGEIIHVEVQIEQVKRTFLVRVTRCRRAGLKVFDVAGEFITPEEIGAAAGQKPSPANDS